MATGAEGAGIVVIVHGHRIELGLARRRITYHDRLLFRGSTSDRLAYPVIQGDQS